MLTDCCKGVGEQRWRAALGTRRQAGPVQDVQVKDPQIIQQCIVMSAATMDVHGFAQECCRMGMPGTWAPACSGSQLAVARVVLQHM